MADPFYIGIRFALYVDLMLLFGVPLFAVYAWPADASKRSQRRVLLTLTLLGLGLSALSIVAMAASMAGVGLAGVDPASVRMMVTDTPMGVAWSARMVALLLLAFAFAVSRRPALQATLAAIALSSLAWTGHGAAGEGDAGLWQLLGDVLHLLAAAAWLGGLFGLGAMVFGPSEAARTHRALSRFATAGTVIVILLVGSGLINAFYLVGWSNLSRLTTTLYGNLLVAKLLLFAAMIGLAAINRLRLVPALGRSIERAADHKFGALRISLVVESGAAVAILALVAWLGTLEPPMSGTDSNVRNDDYLSKSSA